MSNYSTEKTPNNKLSTRDEKNIVTHEEKQLAIEQAEQVQFKERETWAKSGYVGYVMKLESTGNSFLPVFNNKKWKSMFGMVKMVKCEIEFYLKASSNGLYGEPKNQPVSTFQLSKSDTIVSAFTDTKLTSAGAGNFLFSIEDPHGKLILGCQTENERMNWITSIKRANDGFIPSKESIAGLKAAQNLSTVPVVVASTNIFSAKKSTNKPTNNPLDDVDISTLPAATQEQLGKISSLLETGLLTQAEYDQLLPVILQQAKEQVKDDEYMIRENTRRKNSSYRKQTTTSTTTGNNAVMVVCNVCSILNSHGGTHCVICAAKLPEPHDLAQQEKVQKHLSSSNMLRFTDNHHEPRFGPDDGNWLCSFQFNPVGGREDDLGTFRCFVSQPVSAMNPATWEQISLYVVGCVYMQGVDDDYQEQWTVRHQWKWYEKFHDKLVQTNLINNSWSINFPVVSPEQVTSTKKTVMEELRLQLSIWLQDILNNVHNPQEFLSSEAVDGLFKIKDNIQPILSQYNHFNVEEYKEVYEEIKKSMKKNPNLNVDDDENFDHVPMVLDELTNADDAGTLLITFLQGDGGAGSKPYLNIFDERVQTLHDMCVSAVPRLQISSDPSHEGVDAELVPQALDVLDHVQRALRVYDEEIEKSQLKQRDRQVKVAGKGNSNNNKVKQQQQQQNHSNNNNDKKGEDAEQEDIFAGGGNY
jgi:hypothetical protein